MESYDKRHTTVALVEPKIFVSEIDKYAIKGAAFSRRTCNRMRAGIASEAMSGTAM